MDEPAAKARQFLIAEAVVAGGILALGSEVSIASYFNLLSLPFAKLFGVGSIILLILLVGHIIYHSLYHSLKEKRRSAGLFLATLADDTSILPCAEPQPIPDETALALPCTFKLQRNWRDIATASVAIMLGAWFLIGPALTRVFTPDDAAGWSLYTTISALCTAACVLLGFIKTTPLQWLEVTDEGLISREGGNPKTLHWEDIRLLAIPPRQRKDEPPGRYQLFRKNAGPGLALDVLRPARKRLFQLYKPAIPFDEYDRQMDALLSLITAKTGLPLYDLR